MAYTFSLRITKRHAWYRCRFQSGYPGISWGDNGNAALSSYCPACSVAGLRLSGAGSFRAVFVMLVLDQVEPNSAPPAEAYQDCTVFQTEAWLDFIEETQHAERVVALVRDGGTVVGRFTGLVVRKLGARVLGSPFPGWSTFYMGFNLDPGISRIEALAALETFAFRRLSCVHFEMMDRQITAQEAEEGGFRYRLLRGFEVDLTQTEEELLAAMARSCRKTIRKSQHTGIIIEEAGDESFAADYHAQLTEVFGRQGLKPTYSRDRVVSLIRHLMPTERVLLLKARTPDGLCTATSISLGFNGRMYSWGAASLRDAAAAGSNEALKWYGMQYWKARGMSVWDLGGWAEHKRKYGGYEIGVPWIRRSKYPGVELMREFARKSTAIEQRMRCGPSRGRQASDDPRLDEDRGRDRVE
jgi:hypothetical protein